MEKKIGLKKYSIVFIGICGVLILFLSSIIYLYSDDVYYATFLQDGWKNFVSMNIDHYMKVNGRALVHALNGIILFFGTKLFSIINPIMIIGFAFIGSKCMNFKKRIHKREDIYISTGITLFFIMCLSKEIISESLYWISGSMNYMFPAFCLVLMYYLLQKNIYLTKNTIILFIVAFLTGATTEQGGFVAIALSSLAVLMALIYGDKHKKRAYILTPFYAGLGLISVILSPGIKVRLAATKIHTPSDATLVEDIIERFYKISHMIAGEGGISNILIVLVFTIVFICLKDKKINKFFVTGSIIIIYILYQRIFNIYSEDLSSITVSMTFIYITLWSVSILKHREYRDAGIFIMAAVSLQCIMLLSPIFGTRTIVITGLLLTVVIGGLAVDVIKNPIYNIISISLISIILFSLESAAIIIVVSIVIFSIKKIRLKGQLIIGTGMLIAFFIPILHGYYENHLIIKQNIASIDKAKKTGNLYWNIDLNDEYRHDLFYENPYFEPYFLQSNKLDKDTEIFLLSQVYKPIFVNGKLIKSPVMKKEVKYFPLRDVFEGLGGKVVWDSDTAKIHIWIANTQYIVEGNNSIIKIENGIKNTITLNHPMQNFYNKTYLPENIFTDFLNVVEKNDAILITSKDNIQATSSYIKY